MAANIMSFFQRKKQPFEEDDEALNIEEFYEDGFVLYPNIDDLYAELHKANRKRRLDNRAAFLEHVHIPRLMDLVIPIGGIALFVTLVILIVKLVSKSLPCSKC